MRLFFLLAVLAAPALAQPVPVPFEVVVPGTLAPLDTVYLVGTFNGWNPGDGYGDSPTMGESLPMEPRGGDRFTLTLDLPVGDSLAYKYTLGSWRSVEKRPDGGELNNRRATVRPGLAVRDTVALWAIASVQAGRWLPEDVWASEYETYQRWLADYEGPRDSLSVTDLDRAVASFQAAWEAEAQRIGYGPMPVSVGMLDAIGRLGGFDRARFDYMFAHHVLPAALERLRRLEEAPPSEALAVSVPQLRNLLGRTALRADLSAEQRAAAHDGLRRLYALLPALRTAAPVRFPDLLPSLDPGPIATDLVLWRVDEARRAGDPDTALLLLGEMLRASSADDFFPQDLVIGPLLAIASEADQPALAFRALDLLLTETSDRFTNLDDLRSRYAAADPTSGPARFERLLPRRPAFILPAVEPAPTVAGTYLDLTSGADFDLASLRGQTVLLDFWATWCAPCIAEIPTLVAFQHEMAGHDDFAFLSVNADAVTSGDSAEAVRAFIEEHGVSYPVLYDEAGRSLVEAFGVRGYPWKFLIEPDGTVRNVPPDVPALDYVRDRVSQSE